MVDFNVKALKAESLIKGAFFVGRTRCIADRPSSRGCSPVVVPLALKPFAGLPDVATAAVLSSRGVRPECLPLPAPAAPPAECRPDPVTRPLVDDPAAMFLPARFPAPVLAPVLAVPSVAALFTTLAAPPLTPAAPLPAGATAVPAAPAPAPAPPARAALPAEFFPAPEVALPAVAEVPAAPALSASALPPPALSVG